MQLNFESQYRHQMGKRTHNLRYVRFVNVFQSVSGFLIYISGQKNDPRIYIKTIVTVVAILNNLELSRTELFWF